MSSLKADAVYIIEAGEPHALSACKIQDEILDVSRSYFLAQEGSQAALGAEAIDLSALPPDNLVLNNKRLSNTKRI